MTDRVNNVCDSTSIVGLLGVSMRMAVGSLSPMHKTSIIFACLYAVCFNINLLLLTLVALLNGNLYLILQKLLLAIRPRT